MPSEYVTRSQWSEEIVKNRRNITHQLLSIIKDNKDTPSEQIQFSRLWYAVHLLGELRAEEAVPTLLEIIDVSLLPDATHEIPIPTDAEVIKSLALIGKPSSELAIGNLAQDKSTIRAPQYLRVIFLVEGPDVGKFMLQNAVNREKDPDKKQRLQKAIELFANADKVVP